jgi:hypothetical protein
MLPKTRHFIRTTPSLILFMSAIVILIMAYATSSPWASFMVLFIMFAMIDDARTRQCSKEFAFGVIQEAYQTKQNHPNYYHIHYRRAKTSLINRGEMDLVRYLPPVEEYKP